MKAFAFLSFLALVALTASAAPTVGIEGQVEVLLPGPELKAKAADRTAPIIVRIAGTRPHGTLIAYDLRYIGLVPGAYDLGKYLLLQDGAPAANLPPIPVQIAGLLPAEHQGQLSPRARSPFPHLGGYKWLMIGAATLWAVLAFPLFRAARRRPESTTASGPAAPPTLAERLRPLVEKATAGPLTADDQAKLERLLLAHWCDRLDLASLDPPAAMAILRAHPEAGALLRALEDWLHRPPGTAKVDLEAVLAPYAKLSTAVPSAP
ncbi:MAG: hypothetical protein QOE70_4166 [Chthoniobacter sp.]|jgi:hypothetical protein|nr:hypothetical protein [Chthoniobacter sp.]